MKLMLGLLALVLVGAVATDAMAQDDATRVKALEQRVQMLEKKLNSEYLQQVNRDQVAAILEEMNADAAGQGALPKWMENLSFYGDLRLRYEARWNVNGSQPDRHRARFRLRFGVKKTWMDKQMEVGFRLASGEASDDFNNETDPTSTNQSFDDAFSAKNIWIDRAYAKYTPNWLKGLTFVGGKFGTPTVHTDLVFDSDVNVEGFWAQFKPEVIEGMKPFVGFGFFVVEEENSGNDVWVKAYEAGLDWTIMKGLKFLGAVTFYDYDDIEDNYRQADGNHEVASRLAAEEFNILDFNLALTYDLEVGGMTLPVKGYFDFAYNCGNKDTGDYRHQENGWVLGMKVGQNKKAGDWSAGYAYKEIQANAVVGQFTDSDFGGAGRKGHVLKAAYNVTDFMTVGAAYFCTQNIKSWDSRRHLVQVDAVWKF